MASPVELIKERLGIEEVVGQYVKLSKAGGSFKACCPFHHEKTPSFFVSPDRGTYYCFGCGAKGDIFSFVEEMEGVDFRQALKQLGEKAGVNVSLEDPKEREEKEILLSAMVKAKDYFVQNLLDNKTAKDYLKKRGLKEETITAFNIGYAPDEWRSLSDYLLTKGFSLDVQEKAGLIKREDNKHYDKFRSRVMFPISDASGKIVAFTGRIIGKEEKNIPKYMNSPETTLFSKSRILFGFDKAKSAIKKQDYAILVEGQMDLIASHQAGFKNTVASSGTALTEDHLSLLGRLSNRIMMVFDADSAGVKAALRAAVLALGRGMEVKVAALPLGSDPADLILKDLEIYRKCLKSSKHIIDFYLDEITSKQKDERKLLREIRDKVLPFVKALESHIERSHFIKKIAESTEISEEAIQQDLEKVESAVSNQEAGEKSVIEERGKGSALEMALAFFLWQKSEKEPKIVVKDFGSALDKIAGNITGLIAKNERATELAFKAEQYYKGKSNLDSDAKELLLNAEEEVLKKRLSLAMKDLHNAEKSGDEKTLKKALSLCQELSRKLDDLKKQRANYS